MAFDDILDIGNDPFLKKNKAEQGIEEELETEPSPVGIPTPAAPSTTAAENNGGGWNTGKQQKNWSTGRKPDVWNTNNP